MSRWVPAACGRDPLRSMRETRGGNFRATEEAPDGDPCRVRRTPRVDHIRRARYRDGRGPDRPHAGRSGGRRRVGRTVRGERVEVAVEACTGWWFVDEALAGAGVVVRLAEPAEAS